MGQYHTFIVRFWTDGSASGIRGHIQHIASRRGIYFRDEAKMLQFLREYLGPLAMHNQPDSVENQNPNFKHEPLPLEGTGTDNG